MLRTCCRRPRRRPPPAQGRSARSDQRAAILGAWEHVARSHAPSPRRGDEERLKSRSSERTRRGYKPDRSSRTSYWAGCQRASLTESDQLPRHGRDVETEHAAPAITCQEQWAARGRRCCSCGGCRTNHWVARCIKVPWDATMGRAPVCFARWDSVPLQNGERQLLSYRLVLSMIRRLYATA